jgi:hypothetical protein
MASVPRSAAAATPSQAPLVARAPRVDFLGIGAQKAGTTWLHKMLGAHPEIFMARGEDKDLRFFNTYYDRGYAWYERYFQEGARARRRGEFSTSYFYSGDAPERVRRYYPDMRLVLSLRDPVKRLISHHKHELRLGRAAHLSLERGIANNPSYVEQSMYFTQLCRWLEHFPLESIHVVIFEELFRDPARALRELYAFVGVDTSYAPAGLHEKVNEGRIPRSRLVEEGVRLSASTLRAVGAGWMIESLKGAGLDKWVKNGTKRPDSALDADDAVVAGLETLFAPENAKLARLLGRDLGVWSKPSSARRGGGT